MYADLLSCKHWRAASFKYDGAFLVRCMRHVFVWPILHDQTGQISIHRNRIVPSLLDSASLTNRPRLIIAENLFLDEGSDFERPLALEEMLLAAEARPLGEQAVPSRRPPNRVYIQLVPSVSRLLECVSQVPQSS
jgi:hypothetical protein